MCKLKLFFARILFKLFSVKRLKNYSLVPNSVDSRDFRFADYNTMASQLQQKVDLREFCSPIEDQLSSSSCVAQSLIGNLEFLEKKSTGNHTDLSRMFTYYTTRMFECDTKRDAGSQIRDGIKVLKKYGVCKEELHPFVVENYALKPSKEAFKDAESRKITKYYKIESLDEMLQCLNQGYPFVGALKLYNSFRDSFETGIVPMPSAGEFPMFNHAVMFVGYDLDNRTFIVRNSWGGNIHGNYKGYFVIPFDYMSYSFDLWTIR